MAAPRITIRRELAGDSSSIRAVHKLAFPTDAESRLVDALRAANQLTLSLIAIVNSEIAGHIAFSPVEIDGEPIGWGLAPLAVVPHRQRTGVGSALTLHALNECRRLNVPLVVVLGDPEFYSRFGFAPASGWQLRDCYDGGDAFQAIFFDDRSAAPHGLVKYAPEFDLVT